eukprot:5661793-Amphidinium_carterae.1
MPVRVDSFMKVQECHHASRASGGFHRKPVCSFKLFGKSTPQKSLRGLPMLIHSMSVSQL